MPRRNSVWMALGAVVISAYMVLAALKWPLRTKLFPLAIGIPVFILALSELVLTLRSREENTALPERSGTSAPGQEERLPLRRMAPGYFIAVGFFVLILLFSFPLAVPLFVFLYMKLYGRENWGITLAVTAAAWASFYGLFVAVLHTLFGRGLLQIVLRHMGIL